MVRRVKKRSLSSIIIHITLIILSLSFIVPIVSLISISFSDEKDVLLHGYSIIPRVFSMEAYRVIFLMPEKIINGYKISIVVTVLGTFLSLIISAMCAYAISRSDFKLRKHITFYLFFTMLFSGGLVPHYILYTQYLDLKNSIWGLILPLLVNVFYIMVLKTFFQSIPFSIIESATIDGASEFSIFFVIIVPLSKPSLAAVSLMIILGYWNDWFMSLLLITNTKLMPLQAMLQQMLREAQEVMRSLGSNTDIQLDITKLPTETARMAMAIIASGPMLFIFPFFQKYFTKGMTVGSLKG